MQLEKMTPSLHLPQDVTVFCEDRSTRNSIPLLIVLKIYHGHCFEVRLFHEAQKKKKKQNQH